MVTTTLLPTMLTAGGPAVRTVWGAEMALDGGTDNGVRVGDGRTTAHGLRAWLDNGAFDEAVVTLRWRLRLRGGVRPGARLVLHDDGEGIVVATVADGVARLTAWLHSDATAAAA